MDLQALPYHEPKIRQILIQSSFILLLNAMRVVFNRLLSCGIVGQILVGVLYGVPSKLPLLSIEFQRGVVSLGYLGLLSLCIEGGLHSSISELWRNKTYSFLVAITGIALPICLSFLLIPIMNVSHSGDKQGQVDTLQAFAAGAALSATSLGTSFTIISGAGLARERVGVILSSAAMLDDVVGLILIAVIQNLGPSTQGTGISGRKLAVAVSRPIIASIGSLVVVALAFRTYTLISTRSAAHDCTRWLNKARALRNLGSREAKVLVAALLSCVAFIAAGTYAGASPLFMAFIAGGAIAFVSEHHSSKAALNSISSVDEKNFSVQEPFAEDGFHSRFLRQAQNYLLLPFFFASIGFAIPIGKMFQPAVVWKGLLYTLLMAAAKFATAFWIYVSRADFTARGNEMDRTLHAPLQPTVATSTPHLQGLGHNSASLLVGFAMIARGEVSFLIASIAQTAGILRNEEIYLVVVWAAFLCTVIGPVGTGIVSRMISRPRVVEELPTTTAGQAAEEEIAHSPQMPRTPALT